MTGTIHRTVLRLEALVARRFSLKRTPRVIEPFIGYASEDVLFVQGRVHSRLRDSETRFGQSRIANLRQMLGMFLTSEVPGAEVHCAGQTVRADEEGYFRVDIPRDGAQGWLLFDASLPGIEGQFACPVFAPPPGDPPMVISDIDDTIMKTGAYSLLKNLWTSLTGNPLTRQVFPDGAVLLDRLNREQECPVFYVSSSPWNLFRFLEAVFDRNAVVPGPMFLRDLGLDEAKFVTDGHGDHKGRAIDTILGANPSRDAILIGDTGQEDAKVYLDASERHGDRIRAVILRTPGASIERDSLRNIEALRQRGVLTLCGRSFAGFHETLTAYLSADDPPPDQGA